VCPKSNSKIFRRELRRRVIEWRKEENITERRITPELRMEHGCDSQIGVARRRGVKI
jgi:hypothetical protein